MNTKELSHTVASLLKSKVC